MAAEAAAAAAANNTTAPSSSKTRPNRLPAPALFVGPPSANASTVGLGRPSVPKQVQAPPAPPPPPTTAARPGNILQLGITPPFTPRQTASHPTTQPRSSLDLNRGPAAERQHVRPRASNEAQWYELQRTLNEVELAARRVGRAKGSNNSGGGGGSGGVGSSGAREGGGAGAGAGAGGTGTWTAGATVFGTRHAEALTRLRDAQIKLAEAWGPIGRDQEEDDDDDDKGEDGDQGVGGKAMGDGEGGVRRGKNPVTDGSGGRDGDGQGSGHGQERQDAGRQREKHEHRQQQEEEEEEAAEQRRRKGESDLKMAAERRRRNDEYFAQVKAGVQDVVAKLGEVSKAMKEVEGEGREMWEESSIGTTATSRAGGGGEG